MMDMPVPSAPYTHRWMETAFIALSIGDVNADREVVGLLASEVISEAIIRAVYQADSAYGFPSAKDFHPQTL